ncbi:MAG: tetratricopeptide repeat protein [Planctomycetes bacterium]|nr:tetratricopeptide repeat protein [Planctomycetota bacterium]
MKAEAERATEQILVRAEGVWREARAILYRTDIPIERYHDKLRACLVLYDEALAKTPDYGWIFESRGRVRTQACDYAAAEFDLIRATQLLGPELGKPARLSLARLYFDQSCLEGPNFFEESRDEAARRAAVQAQWRDKAIEELRACSGAPGWRGTLEEQASLERLTAAFSICDRDRPRALEILTEGLKGHGDEDCAWALYHCSGDARDPSWLEEALKIRPRHALALLDRAHAHARETNPRDALREADSVLAIQENLWYARALRALMRSEVGMQEEALQEIESILVQKPEWPGALLIRSIVQHRRKNTAAALKDVNEVLVRHPGSAMGHQMRGMIRAKSGDLQGAITDFDEAIRLKPDSSRNYSNRGATRARLGDVKGALSDYGESIALNPQDPDLYVSRAGLRMSRADFAGAADDFRKALEVAPPDWPRRAQIEKTLQGFKLK